MKKFALMFAGLLALGTAGTSRAELTFTITEVGGNVVAVGSGTVNMAGLTYDWSLNYPAFTLGASGATFVGGPASASMKTWGDVSGPSSYGTGAKTFTDSGRGDTFGIMGSIGRLYLPAGYTSGSLLSGTSTWNSNTLSGLGLTPGTYDYTWGSGANADSAHVIIGAAAVPEPSSIIMAGMGLVGAVTLARRKRKAVVVA